MLFPSFTDVIRKIQTNVKNQPWSNPFIIALCTGIVLTALFALIKYDFQSAAVALLIAGASFVVSAVIGFLFGIPRALQQNNGENKKNATTYAVNTNLEQISDWLTKIIVGLGLTQIGSIPSYFMSMSDYYANAFAPQVVPPSLVATIISYFGVCGFLTFYLYTRLILTTEFSKADRAADESPEYVEGLIQAMLYRPPPKGFEDALAAADDYLKRYGDGNWRISRSIACANGQKHQYLMRDPKSDPKEIANCKAEALNALKHLLYINPAEKESMRALWDPKLATPQENDLTTFFNDPDFIQVFN